jgi:hypothetical protein
MLNFKVIVIHYFLTLLLNRDANSGSLFYIDVCVRGSLKHSVLYPAIIDKKPAAAVDIFRQMMHEFNQSVNEIIRTTGNEFCKLFGRLTSTSCSHVPLDDPVEAFSLKIYQLDSVRLACAITPLQIPCINEYAELCIITGFDLNDAVQLLQVLSPKKSQVTIYNFKKLCFNFLVCWTPR